MINVSTIASLVECAEGDMHQRRKIVVLYSNNSFEIT